MPSPFLRHGRRRTQRGFSLFEVLVAVFILCVGIVGTVGMQTASLQANAQTRHQVTATALASELAEAMRGNHHVALNNDPDANPFLIDHAGGTPASPDANCQSGDCTGIDDTARLNAARWLVHEWQQRAIAQLPSPRIVVCFDSAAFDASGQTTWACDGAGSTAVAKMAWNHRDTTGALVYATAADQRPLVVMPISPGSAE